MLRAELDQHAATGGDVGLLAVELDESGPCSHVIDLVFIVMGVSRNGLAGLDPDMGDVQPIGLEDRPVVGIGFGLDGQVVELADHTDTSGLDAITTDCLDRQETSPAVDRRPDRPARAGRNRNPTRARRTWLRRGCPMSARSPAARP